MQQKRQTPPPVTLYNAQDRFNMLARQVADIADRLEPLKDNAHPATLDLYLNYSMINMSIQGLAPSFDKGKTRQLNPKNLKALADLEMIVFQFRDVVEDAREELLNS